MSLDSYNSTYPLEYYEVGTCYSFYKASNVNAFRGASKDEIEAYSDALERCYSENKHIMVAGGSTYDKSTCRAIGVVIAKGSYDFEKRQSYEFPCFLEVMFLLSDGKYVVTKYAVASPSVFFNDKESTLPGTLVTIESKNSGGNYHNTLNTTSNQANGIELTKATRSGPTEVRRSGPTEVKMSGPTEVKRNGPTEVR